MTNLFAYVGPGAGFAFLGSFLTVFLAAVAGIVSVVAWPFRMAWLLVRRRGALRRARVQKIIFLGLDGLDPKLTEQWMDEGKLPNLARLREQGSYTRLRTTIPAMSPVAWSTFATGVNPAKHNIFDFLNRDLRTYAPELSSARVRPPSRIFKIGTLRIPFSRPTVDFHRKSEPFWKILGRHAIGSTILRVPITFPPEPFKGRMLSAMATPDLRGTQGTFSKFTAPGSTLDAKLTGPDGIDVPFRVAATPAGATLQIQNQTVALRTGVYSSWIKLTFRAGPGLAAKGIVRFLLTETTPNIAVYVTPIEIDPEHPALPISHPPYYAAYLAKLLGTFATLGMAEDTSALNEGAIDEEAFLSQTKLIQQEREQMFFAALDRTRRGAVACVFDTPDRVQHMFYRDPAVLETLYRDMDRIAGRTMQYADAGTALFVLSDHGFCAFNRGVNINSWLRDNSYLTVHEDNSIDWTRTRAYTLGLAGIYINQTGREAQGIVDPNDAPQLKRDLIARLTNLPDETGEIAIQSVYETAAIYKGPYADAAPDLIVGYAAGYRTSWDAALGRVSPHVFEENTKHWCGDHCVDPKLVPGVLFSNCTISADDPGIEDLAPTALDLFGVDIPGWMEGKPLVQGA